jgi:histidinol-phosphate aminotransferase
MFDIKKLLRKNIRELKPYSSARDEFQGTASVFLDANENPYETGINRYPDPLQIQLKSKISIIKQINSKQIFLGNGSDEAIDLLIRAFCEPGKDNIVSINPTYGMYKVCADINNIEYRDVLLNKDFSLNSATLLNKTDSNSKIIFLCSPNNPTGNSLETTEILKVFKAFKGIVVVDEAYIDFSKNDSLIKLIDNYPNLVILQTFSKAWGMAGIRLGMAYAAAELIQVLNKIKYPYNVNVLTQQEALKQIDKNVNTIDLAVSNIISEKKKLWKELTKFNSIIEMYPSDANFLLIKVTDAKNLYNFLCEKEVIVRDRSNVDLCDNCLRITIGTPEENSKFLEALAMYDSKIR